MLPVVISSAESLRELSGSFIIEDRDGDVFRRDTIHDDAITFTFDAFGPLILIAQSTKPTANITIDGWRKDA